MKNLQLIKKQFVHGNLCLLLIGVLSFPKLTFSQETNTQVVGIVNAETKQVLQGATVSAVHEPTKNTFFTQTNSKGLFFLFNLKPGGPYTLTISYTGFEIFSLKKLYIGYGTSNFYSGENGEELSKFLLKQKKMVLAAVTITTGKTVQTSGTEVNIDKETIAMLPSISRNLQDYVRLVPQAKVNGSGMMSFLGQSNKFNTFFIDGSSSNDMLGISNSGTAGGQTNTPPVSIEAIEDLKISLSPFDVQYSHFTGASINAITRSGSNEFKSAAWYYFRNEKMAGKSPLPVEKPEFPGVVKRTRLDKFFNNTSGVWASGALVQNQLFYFLLAEMQDELQPQPYSFSVYRGVSSYDQINAFADTLRTKYGYEPGSLQSENQLFAKKFIVKLDWNPGIKNKFTLSYRLNKEEKEALPEQNSSNSIRFSNNSLLLNSKINAASFEWRRYFNRIANNRLLLTFNNEVTDREPVGQPFPTINIKDGSANIITGSPPSSHLNLFKGSEFNLLNIFRLTTGKHILSAGLDIKFSTIKDIAVPSYFGQYTYGNLQDFINNAFPRLYVRNASLVDQPIGDITKAAAHFNTMRLGGFVNTEIQANENLKLNMGLRLDGNSLPLSYEEDVFFNTIARSEVEKYYDLEGAVSGRPMNTHWQLAPRFGFQYRIPDEQITVRGGAGIFTGHILNLWASEFYFANTYNLTVQPAAYGLYFNPDPFGQPDYQSLGIDPEKSKGKKVLVAENFKYPTVFRSSLGFDKKLGRNWLLTSEVIVSKNIHEHKYINVNLLSPSKSTPLPDRRNVYSVTATPEKIPMNGGNPYQYIFLLTNNKEEKGFAYNASITLNTNFNNRVFINTGYTYGNSISVLEPGGLANSSDQWKEIETVNGKNFTERSVSDFDIGHRAFITVAKKFNYGNWSTLLSIFYNAQSGSSYSYVYDGTMINDDGIQSNFDLMYIPTTRDLANMIFLPISGTNPLTPDQQKMLLNEFIEKDKYLHKHRGAFAERNGARLPFTHIVDLRFQQSLAVKTRKRVIQLTINYDIFNFTNMLHKDWGRIYFLTGDNYRLIRFAGFSGNTLLPQYQYDPVNGKPWSTQTSSAPGNSARWISQLGLKINFN